MNRYTVVTSIENALKSDNYRSQVSPSNRPNRRQAKQQETSFNHNGQTINQ